MGTKQSSKKGTTTKVTKVTTEAPSKYGAELAPMVELLETIEKESKDFAIKSFNYALLMGEKLSQIKKIWESDFKPKNLIQVFTTDFEKDAKSGKIVSGYKVNLANAKSIKDKTTNELILGFWDYLTYEGFLPFKYGFGARLLRLYENQDKFKELSTEQKVAARIQNSDKADAYLSHLKKGGNIDTFIEEVKEKDLPKVAEPVTSEGTETGTTAKDSKPLPPKPMVLDLWKGDAKAVKIHYNGNEYTTDGVKTAIVKQFTDPKSKQKISDAELVGVMNVLLAHFGVTKVSPTNLASITKVKPVKTAEAKK
ncbi:MAG: hypothetical protein J5I47_07050 [Vicingus serpentipes]|nr:hypothetical protein [Vicingus serpentipes]